jgi:hypothetical protein
MNRDGGQFSAATIDDALPRHQPAFLLAVPIKSSPRVIQLVLPYLTLQP